MSKKETTEESFMDARSFVSKMMRSQEKKKKILNYMSIHYPHLLKNPHRKQRVRNCCNVLRFINYGKDKRKLYEANFCKYDKFCLACATRRSIKKIQWFLRGIEYHGLETKKWYHITLTIRHNKSQSLEFVLEKLMRHKEQLTQKVRNSRRSEQKQTSFFAQFDGMVSSIELTHGKHGRHPHIHIVACTDIKVATHYDNYLGCDTNKDAQKEWKSITKDSFCVAVRRIDMADNQYSRKGVAEVFKYAVKFSSLSIPNLVKLIALQKKKNYRFYATTGLLRGWKIPEVAYQKKLLYTEMKNTQSLLLENYHYNREEEKYKKGLTIN